MPRNLNNKPVPVENLNGDWSICSRRTGKRIVVFANVHSCWTDSATWELGLFIGATRRQKKALRSGDYNHYAIFRNQSTGATMKDFQIVLELLETLVNHITQTDEMPRHYFVACGSDEKRERFYQKVLPIKADHLGIWELRIHDGETHIVLLSSR